MNADNRAHPAGIGIGTGGEKQYPENGPETGIEGKEVNDQCLDREKIAHKCQAGGKGNCQPGGMLEDFSAQQLAGWLHAVLLASFVGRAFKFFFKPDVDKGPYGLWAEVTAPDPAQKGGNKKTEQRPQS